MIYRALRDGQRDAECASRDMALCCGALDALGKRWTSAKGVARLARRLLRLLSSSKNGYGGTQQKQQILPHCGESPDAEHTDMRTSAAASPPIQMPSMPLATMITPPQGLEDSETFQQQLPQSWGVSGPYTQLDTAFIDLFDYGMPNVFRDPTTWEYLHVLNEVSSPTGGNDLLGAASYSLRETEVGYGYMSSSHERRPALG
jgi:hypothetical protein